MTTPTKVGRRLYKHTDELVWRVKEARGPKIETTSQLLPSFAGLENQNRECFFVLTLNQKLRVIDRYLIAVGSLTECLVHPREVFRPAIMDGAAAIIAVHNHPSGETKPSRVDLNLCRRLDEASDLLGIRLLDFVILGREWNGAPSLHSFAETGELKTLD